MAAVLVIWNHRKDEVDNMKRPQISFGITVLALGFLSAVPGIRATKPPEVDAHGNTIGEPLAPDVGASASLPYQTTATLSLSAVTDSSADAAEADNLSKQLAKPISSLISVTFQANEDFGFGPSHNGY